MAAITLKNRVAVITGAGNGIGRTYAIELARRGAKVVVNDLGTTVHGEGAGPEPADGVVDEIRSFGGTAVPSYDTVSTMEGGRNIIAKAVDTFGTVDILINNAGILRDRSFLKMSEEEWDEVIAVHLKGPFAVTQPALRVMKEKNYGRVVFTASTSGLFGNFGQTHYGAAKLGVVGMMNSLKIEMAKYDITFNTVAPTADSRMTENLFNEEIRAQVKTGFNVPLVMNLVSDENRLNGMIFCMKCGWYARSAILSARGARLGDENGELSAEAVGDAMTGITDMTGAVTLESGAETFRLVEESGVD